MNLLSEKFNQSSVISKDEYARVWYHTEKYFALKETGKENNTTHFSSKFQEVNLLKKAFFG